MRNGARGDCGCGRSKRAATRKALVGKDLQIEGIHDNRYLVLKTKVVGVTRQGDLRISFLPCPGFDLLKRLVGRKINGALVVSNASISEVVAAIQAL